VVSDSEALVELLRRLNQQDYRFTAITPLSHARVLARPWSGPARLEDIFGWSRLFDREDISADLLDLLEAADAVESIAGKMRSRLRVASLNGDLFLHSAFPTESEDAVFFGPDTYRFARWLQAEIPQLSASPTHIIDMGAGSGAGAVAAARLLPRAKVTLVDVNPSALRLAAANTAAAGVGAERLQSDRLPPNGDLVIANPPYMIDPAGRAYRNGGDLFGGAVALDWARQALESRATMLLYTGAAFTADGAPLIRALWRACREAGATMDVEEIDRDVFGEELDQPAYAQVQRIAAIGAVIRPAA
jgi:methylase of polypeptide subunit release factors